MKTNDSKETALKEKNQDEISAEKEAAKTENRKEKPIISMDDFRDDKKKDTPLTHYVPQDEQQYDHDDDKPSQ